MGIKKTRSMPSLRRLATILMLTQAGLAHRTLAQSVPTATQPLQLSAFVAATGVYTNLDGGRNLDITAGADLAFLGLRLFQPAIEARGSYPIYSGHISSQKNFLIGPKVAYPIGRLQPYADFLMGRGAIDYLNGGHVVGPLDYLSSNTFLYSPGAGLDYDLTHHIAVKADVQLQHWSAPVTASGSLHPTALTLGLLYTFDFNRDHRHRFQ